MNKQSELMRAQQLLESFERLSAGQNEDHEAFVALEEGLGLLVDVQDSALEKHDRERAIKLFNAYARITEERVACLLDKTYTVPNRVFGHWYKVMEEFASCGLPLTDSFQEKQSQLVECIIENIRHEVRNLPAKVQNVLWEKYPLLK